MKKIKNVFKLLSSKTKSEKLLLKVVNEHSFKISFKNQVLRKNCIFFFISAAIVEGLAGKNGSQDARQTTELLFESLLEQTTPEPALKILYIIHESICSGNENIKTKFLTVDFTSVHDWAHKSEGGDVVLKILCGNYYNYMICLSNYHIDIKKYQLIDPDMILKMFKKEDYKDLVHLVTFKNVLKYAFKILDSIETSVVLTKYFDTLLTQISLRILKDCAEVYNIISKTVKKTIPEIFELGVEIALLLDELYSDLIQLTKRVREGIQKTSVEESDIPLFELFHIDPEFNKKEELYIVALKKKNMPSTIKSYTEYMQEYQTIKTSDEYNFRPVKSTTDTNNISEDRKLLLNDNEFSPIKKVNTAETPRSTTLKNKSLKIELPYEIDSKEKIDLEIVTPHHTNREDNDGLKITRVKSILTSPMTHIINDEGFRTNKSVIINVRASNSLYHTDQDFSKSDL